MRANFWKLYIYLYTIIATSYKWMLIQIAKTMLTNIWESRQVKWAYRKVIKQYEYYQEKKISIRKATKKSKQTKRLTFASKLACYPYPPEFYARMLVVHISLGLILHVLHQFGVLTPQFLEVRNVFLGKYEVVVASLEMSRVSEKGTQHQTNRIIKWISRRNIF